MVVIAPHPDDETLGIGGLIVSQRQNGVPILLIAVTDGENAYADSVRLGDVRSEEQASAAARLGVERDDILRLHCEDSNVREEQRTIVERLTPLVSSETHIVAPWPHDFHPDHEACGAAALELARAAKARLTFYFFWTWHRGTPALLEAENLQAFPLSGLQRTAKADALACHVSQLSHPSGDPILHDIHLWPASLPFEVYLAG
jgi:LmbE family N-acetylglucosaminyl deacetylase